MAPAYEKVLPGCAWLVLSKTGPFSAQACTAAAHVSSQSHSSLGARALRPMQGTQQLIIGTIS